MLSARLTTEFTNAENDSNYFLFGNRIAPELENGFVYDPQIYLEVISDADVRAALQQRVLRVTSREWEIIPGGKRSIDIAAANWLREYIVTKPLDYWCSCFLEAIILGFKPAEVIWEQNSRYVGIKDIKFRDISRFCFIYNRNLDESRVASKWGYELRLLRQFNTSIDGEEIPDARKMIVHSVGSTHSNPMGLGLAQFLIWLIRLKKESLKSAAIAMARFAQPVPIGYYPEEGSKTEVERFLSNFSEGSWAAVPSRYKIEILDAASNLSGDSLYQFFPRYCESQINKIILSRQWGNDANQGLSGAPAQADSETALQLIKSDADMLSQTLNETLITWLTEFNFPSAVPPTLWRVFPEIQAKEEEAKNKRADRDVKLHGIGFKLKPEVVASVYGDDYEPIETSSAPQDDQGEEPSSSLLPENYQFSLGEDEPVNILIPSDFQFSVQPLGESIEFAVYQLSDETFESFVNSTARRLSTTTSDWLQKAQNVITKIAGMNLSDEEKFNLLPQELSKIYADFDIAATSKILAEASSLTNYGGQVEVEEEMEDEL